MAEVKMNGVHLTKAVVVHEDERRKILEICNGMLTMRSMKILLCKKGDHILGEHWHTYPEVRYLMKGKVHYKLKHVITNETAEFDMVEGEILYTTGFVIHTGLFAEDSIMIDGAQEAYLARSFNDHVEKIWNER